MIDSQTLALTQDVCTYSEAEEWVRAEKGIENPTKSDVFEYFQAAREAIELPKIGENTPYLEIREVRLSELIAAGKVPKEAPSLH